MRAIHVLFCAGSVFIGLSCPAANFNTAMMESTFKITDGKANGTCFMLAKPLPDGKHAFALVTAQHVLEALKGDVATLVLHRKDASNNWSRLEHPVKIREKGTPLWDTHSTKDVAGLFVSLPSGAIPNRLSVDNLVTEKDIKELAMGAGLEVRCLGFPQGMEGPVGGFPILKRGVVASYPLLQAGETTFLIDSPVTPGYSGGPVYVALRDPVVNGEVVVGRTYSGLLGMLIENTGETKIVQTIQNGQQIKREDFWTPLHIGVVMHASVIRELIDEMVVPPAKGPPGD